jgi:circadian clock protein KaiC
LGLDNWSNQAMASQELSSAPIRSETGIPGLDDILNGGLIAHSLYLLDGNPGSGKTTLALQYLMAGVQRGEPCLYVTLSETAKELRAGAASHGWSLDGIELVELVTDDSALESESMVTMYHPSEVELTETTSKILQAVERINPSRLVLDSLSELRLLAQSSLRYRRQILALKQFFAGRRCTVLLIDDRTAERSDLQLQSLAHGVISLEQYNPLYGSTRRRLVISKLRGSNYRGGYHDFAINESGVEVFPRLIANEHSVSYTQESVESGVEGLDTLLGGGPDRGTSTLLMGPAGSGKSTVALQFAIAAARRGDHAVVFAFDESPASIENRCRALGMEFPAGMGPGKIRVQQVDPAELSPGEFVHRVRNAVEMDDAKVVVIDSINGYLNAMPPENYLTAQLHELLTFLGRRGVSTFLVVAQHGVVGIMQAPVDTTYLADTVVLFRYFEYAGQVRKAISVVKKRSGSHEKTIRELQLNSSGIHLSEPLEQFKGVLLGNPEFLGEELVKL